LTDLSICIFIFLCMWTVFMLCFATSLLILLDTFCW
jgi:hypothetical protein